MERNNLKKITGNRWFLPVVCAASFVFGWWYLSITTCAPLGGDDEIINLQNYYYITHTPWWQVVLTHAKEILNQLALQSPRFRPFSSPPVRSLNSWFLGDLVVYRLYILAWTYADITLTAWLTAKATHSKKLGALAFCLLPMMFSLWQDATGNSMYSYGALAQSTLLPVLLAAGMAFSVVWQRSAARSYEEGGRAYTVFAEGVEAGLADAAGTETSVVTDYPVWGGDLEAENAFFLRYADTDTNAHSLAVWRTESHDEATACRLGFALGSDKRTDISWLGTAADDNLDTVTGVTVYLPKQADPAGTLAYTTRAADGTETEHTQPLAELAQTKAENGGTLVTLPETAPIVGDTLRLQS